MPAAPDPLAALRGVIALAHRLLDAIVPPEAGAAPPAAGPVPPASHAPAVPSAPPAGPVPVVPVPLAPAPAPASPVASPGVERTAADAVSAAVVAQRWQRALAAISDAVVTVSLTGTVLDCGPSVLGVLGWTPQELTGRRIVDLVDPEDQPLVAAVLDGLASEVVAREQLEIRLRTGRGETRWAQTTFALVRDERGAPVELLGVLRDVHDRKLAADRAAEEAVNDSLTGLRNRRGMAQALSSLSGNGRPLAVLACDVDGFRLVNEDLGHDAGDEVLLEIADRLKVMVRGSDCVARVKADHFLVVLPDADLAGALAVGERLVEVVREPIVTAGGTANLTMCVGLAYTESLGVDPLALVAAADDAVALAKGAGRDRLVVAG